MSPLVSIITPSFNQANFLSETINSVLNQEYANIEFIIVDGLSSDATSDILASYRTKLAKVIEERDIGQADAINKGILASHGDIIGWINSDDIFYPGTISEIVKVFIGNPEVEVVYGNVDYGSSSTNVINTIMGQSFEFLPSFRKLSIPMPQQGCFWRRTALTKCGLLNVEFHYVLDRDYFIRLADKCNLLYIDRTMGLFRSHIDSKSVKFQLSWIKELNILYRSYFASQTLSHAISEYESEVTAAVSLTSASLALTANRPLMFLKYLLMAFFKDPLFAVHPFFLSRVRLLK